MVFYTVYFETQSIIEPDKKINLSIEYSLDSQNLMQIYLKKDADSTSKGIILPAENISNGDRHYVKTNFYYDYSHTQLEFNLGRIADNSTLHIEKVEIEIEGSKYTFSDRTLITFFKHIGKHKLSEKGKVEFDSTYGEEDYVLNSRELTPVLLLYNFKSKPNILLAIIVGLILAFLSLVVLYLFDKNKTKLIHVFSVKKKLLVFIAAILFVGLNAFAILYLKRNKSNYLEELVARKGTGLFAFFDNNPKDNLLYNGDFKYNLLFWGVNADSTFVKHISTPYGNGVEIERTDGNNVDFSFRYYGRSPIYYPNHTYKIVFKCKVVKGDGIPFNIGWWTQDGHSSHKPAFLPLEKKELGNGWLEITAKYTFQNKNQKLVFFLNSLKDYSVIELADIKLIDLDFDPKLQVYIN